MEYRDYYATLGVPRTASQAEIKKAYRKLARKHHPDVNKGDAAAERRFKEVNEANAVLGDPEKRKLYDELGADWEQVQRAQQAGAAQGGRGGPGAGGPFAGYAGFGGAPGQGVRFEYHGNPEDLAGFSDFFRTFFGGGMGGAGDGRAFEGQRVEQVDLEDLLGGLRYEGEFPVGGAAPRTRGGPVAAPRQHLEAAVDISLEEAYHGTKRLVQIDDRRLEVTIPRGVATGQRIRLSGKAGSGPRAGNIYLDVTVRDHPTFTRRADDLQRELPIALHEAVLGADVPVATLKGRVLLKIPEGTQNGRIFRLAGQGMPHFRADGFGDLFVKVRVVLPSGLDEGDRQRFRAFAEALHQPDPRASEPAARTERPTGAPA
jgi:curved DNA-binding protein